MLFDRYIAVDWSAANGKKTGSDSIWIADLSRDGLSVENPSTRAEALASLIRRLSSTKRERVFAGFDFPFGYPKGAAEAIAGKPGWAELWKLLRERVQDGDDNASNRFVVGGSINKAMRGGGPLYWGHHHMHAFDGLTRKRPLDRYSEIAEKRMAEARARTAQPVWKLYGNGSVGSQAMLGIARLEALRHHPVLGPEIAIWPFETDFTADLSKRIIVAEIYPSIVKVGATRKKPKDQVQVETMVGLFADRDSRGTFARLIDAPADLKPEQRKHAVEEEGWIVGLDLS